MRARRLAWPLAVVLCLVIVAGVGTAVYLRRQASNAGGKAQGAAQAGSSAGGSKGRVPYSEQMRQLIERGQVKSALGRQVLADGKISHEELEAVKSAYVACMARAGFTVVIDDRGAGSMTGKGIDVAQPDGAAKLDAADNSCAAQTDWNTVDYLYLQMFQNPDQIDPLELQYECMIYHKVFSKDSMSFTEFKATLLSSDGFPAAIRSGKEFRHCNEDSYAPGTW